MKIQKIENFPIAENTFIIAEPSLRKCVVVDPFEEEAILTYMGKMKLDLQYIFLTHEHIDHIRAVNGLRAKYDCKLVCSQLCSQNICDSRKNLSDFFKILLDINGTIELPEKFGESFVGYQCEPADLTFERDYCLYWGEHKFEFFSTPGHTDASICILLDKRFLFSGDSLLRETEVTTRLPSGSKAKYEKITIPFLATLNREVIVYPGHGEHFFMKEKELGTD